MLKYLIEIFCKDTHIGLCDLGLCNKSYSSKNIHQNKKSGTYKNMYSDKLFTNDYIDFAFKDSFSIDQIACHL